MTLDVRLAPPLDAYRPLPYRGEDVRAVIRREPCACGEVVVQIAGDDLLVTAQRHNASAAHLIWRAEGGE